MPCGLNIFPNLETDLPLTMVLASWRRIFNVNLQVAEKKGWIKQFAVS